MSLHKEHNENQDFSDVNYDDEDLETLSHKKHIRRMIEDRLERKRLKEELDELDSEFDWDELDK